MLGRAILPEISELIQKRDFSTLKEIFEDWHPSELADAFADLRDTEQAITFRLLSKEQAAAMFEYLELDTQLSLLKSLGHEEVSTILNEILESPVIIFNIVLNFDSSL